jgi:hypothetical protein
LDFFNPLSPASPLNPNNPNNPLSPANPLNPNNPDNPLEPVLGPLIDNATAVITSQLENGINGIVEAAVRGAGVRDFYNLYIEGICEGDATGANGMHITDCSSYEDRSAGTLSLSCHVSHSHNVHATIHILAYH